MNAWRLSGGSPLRGPYLGVGVRTLNGVDCFGFGTLFCRPALCAILVAGFGGMYLLHTAAVQIDLVNGATAALFVGEKVHPGMIGVWWLGGASRPGFAWLAVLSTGERKVRSR